MKTKIGFVGTTHPHSYMFLNTLKLLDEVEEIVIAEADEEATKIEKVTRSYAATDELLEKEKPPIVFIMRRANEVLPIALKCIESGAHIFIDKHGTNTSEAMRKITESAEKKGVFASTGFVWRLHPATAEIKSLIQRGILGTMMLVEIRMVTTSIPARRGGLMEWLFDKEVSGGGILIWLACHCIDLARYVLSDEVTAVSAVVNTLGDKRADVEDVASVSLLFQSGAVGSISAGYIMPSGLSQGYDSYLAFRGTLGDVRWDPTYGEALYIRSVHPSWRSIPERSITYRKPEVPGYGGSVGREFFTTFIRGCLEGKKPIVSTADLYECLRIVESAYESSLTGKLVRLR